jgi:hypothetical protein
MMTEQQATARWCPFARVARIESTTHGASPAVIVGGTNRDALGKSPNPVGSCRCIGSACMAWRWAFNVEDKLDTKGRRTGRQLAEKTDEGYCGLSGRPGP